MIKKSIQALVMIPISIGLLFNPAGNHNLMSPLLQNTLLAQREMSLDNRYANQFVNEVMKKNILLNLAYLAGRVKSGQDINWEEITKPFQYKFILNPNKTFAFHEDIADKYKGNVEKTTNAHFNFQEGFKTDGYLFGDGVCHLASLLNWAAKDAKLEVEAPTNHDFAKIPDISRQYGVSIYSNPNSKGSNALQNLYITNNKDRPVFFQFAYQDNKVKVSITD